MGSDDTDGHQSPHRLGPLRRRERVYKGVIAVLILWNIYQQYRSSDAQVVWYYSSPGSAEDSSVGTFTAPSNTVEAYGSARVVCSGCTDGAGVDAAAGNASAALANGTSSGNGNTTLLPLAAAPANDSTKG